jgi:hypothetical protein
MRRSPAGSLKKELEREPKMCARQLSPSLVHATYSNPKLGLVSSITYPIHTANSLSSLNNGEIRPHTGSHCWLVKDPRGRFLTSYLDNMAILHMSMGIRGYFTCMSTFLYYGYSIYFAC